VTLIGFTLKNATVVWWRSLTLGAFLFCIALVMVLFDSMSLAVKQRVDNVIVRGLTGHIQIRPEKSAQTDMVEMYNTGWDDIAVLAAPTANAVRRIVEERLPDAVLTPRVRHSVSLFHGAKREQSLVIGVEPGFNGHSDAFLLAEGRYLSPGREREILLTREQANNLKAKVGDTIELVARNIQGLTAELDFRVCGIGDFIMLSLFSYKACFVDISSARLLLGLEPGDATDLITFLPQGDAAVDIGRELSRSCIARGIPAVFQADERLSSNELFAEEGLLPTQKTGPEKIRISTWQDMGKTFRGAADVISAILTLLIVFLMAIVSILIVNLIGLMGIERNKEIGTLRAIGYPKNLVIRLFMGEIMAVSALSAIAGALVGVALVLTLGRTGIPSPVPALDFIMGKTLYPRLSGGQVASILGIILAFSFGASLLPALRACSLKPADTLRDE
jgi:putative ABC transport system permease protein